ncbi:U4/U6 small nuclear ribonucleoprotein Prp4 [Galendromus occidentalis]|uniref:U4/U6 small nuclear ribonucleoprotein Prp4 n=1 Tax=Galendromus occidentalis TaxID=34638 RepID=A0AAJ7L633_9ACAR|nr:U4/U6 small nuclear ribonucleoprotein Prp4 [Galendromus occidentalis]
MSDSEDEIQYVKRARTVHYGGLEEQERLRQESRGDSTGSDSDSGDDSPGPSGKGSAEFMALEEEKMTREKKLLLDELERKKRARKLNVPTDDGQVRMILRDIGQPICLFGEGPADRRERLRSVLAKDETVTALRLRPTEEEEQEARGDETTWYHEGPDELKAAREWILRYSIPRAKERLARERNVEKSTDSQRTARKQKLFQRLRGITIAASQIGDERPIASCEFSPNEEIIATASWSGLCKLWKTSTLEELKVLRGHQGQASCVTFHPHATLKQSPTELNLASCSTDGAICLWNLESDAPVETIRDMQPHRVSRVAFHPSGRFLACCVYDNTWRLIDMEKNLEILYQEGHSKPVHDIAFHCDGSLAATAGRDAFGRLWDLRTGRCVMFLEGHLKDILTADFAPNGYLLCTGGQDNAVKIWDLRQRRCEYTIPAHTNIVTKVKFDRVKGEFLLTASYDNTLKLWAAPDWTPVHTLKGHDGKIMGCDLDMKGETILSSSFDRTFKLWQQDDLQ